MRINPLAYVFVPLGFKPLYPQKLADEAISKFVELLLPGGKLVMDCFNPWEEVYESGGINKSCRRVNVSKDESIEAVSSTVANRAQKHLISTIHYTKYFGAQAVAQEEEEMNLLWYSEEEMALLLKQHGFKKIYQTQRVLNGEQHTTFIATV